MSLFYQSLPYSVAKSFKLRKKKFKKEKPCCICGKIYPSHEMMVAHKRPVAELSDWEALYDIKNWEVRCIYCERDYNRKNAIMKKIAEEKNGNTQVEQPRGEEEEVHGTVCEDGSE